MGRESKKWSEFIADLWRKLSTYEIQKDKKKYNVAEIEYWGESDHEQGIDITKNNFESFINKTARYDIKEHEYINNITITETQLAELNHILSLTLKVEVNKSCSMSDNLVIIKGDYVKFSDFIQNDGRVNTSVGCYSYQIEHIKVYAQNTVFVDRDIKMSRWKASVEILSPRWEIIGTRVMTLNGAVHDPSKPYDDNSENDSDDESSGDFHIVRGDGRPGRPGGQGGSFVGIGAEFVNGGNFKIISNGGNGEAGVNGENGKDGSNGYFAMVVDSHIPCQSDWCDDGIFTDTSGAEFPDCNRDYYHEEWHFFSPTKRECQFLIHGKPGEPGEDGGNGGRGGEGGFPGEIILFELNGTSGISWHNEKGEDGKDGAGGQGGYGGVNGDKVRIKFTEKNGWVMGDSYGRNERNEQGKNGIDGGNELNMAHASRATPLRPVDILNKYKSYLRENLNDRSKRHALMQFLYQLDNDDTVKSLYDMYGLWDEVELLEEQLHTLNDDVDLIPLYQSLLNRIREYTLNVGDFENSRQEKKFLMNLYTTVLGRIAYLTVAPESKLIIDIEEYLDMINREIERVQNLQITSIEIDLINSYTENQKRNIDREIEEAMYTIQQQITPDINDTSVQIDERIDGLLNEIEALQKLAESEQRDLIDKRVELMKAIEFRRLLNDLKAVAQMVTFFGSIGLSAGSLIGSITSASGDSSVVDDHINHASQIVMAKVQEIDNLREFLDDIARMMNAYPEKFNDELAKIADMKIRLSENNYIKVHQVLMMEYELRDELRGKHGNVAESTNEGNSDEMVAAVKATINKAIELYALGHDIYHKLKNNQAKVNVISASIAQQKEETEQIGEYKTNIHNTMISMLRNGEDNFVSMSKSFDVAKWQVQSFLKDIKSNVTMMTEKFEDLNDYPWHCVEMLQDTMTTLINAYDVIQQCQTERKFIDSHTNESSINGIDMKHYLAELIKSNYVIMRRKMAIEVFKNFVFPLAQEYVKNSTLTSLLRLGSDFDNLLLQSEEQMKKVKSQVDTYKTYLHGAGHHPNIKLAPFKSGYTSTRPFFAWKNSQHKETISKLLSGQRVTVTADIEDSPVYKDAIKFSVAEFFFNARNKTMQSEINDVLNGFEVEAWHRGDSHYRCNNKIYRLNSNVTSISYYLEKGADGKPLSKSLTYVKLEQSESILSPYATWEVILIETGDRFTFRDLDKYKDVVDLELMGYGSYIDNRRVDYSKLLVDNYYRPIKTYKGLNSKYRTSDGTSSNRHVRSAYWPNDHSETSDAPPKSLMPITYEGNFFTKNISKIKNLHALKSITNWYGGKSIKIDETSHELDSPNDYVDSFESASIGVVEEIPDESDSPYDLRDSFEFNTESTRNISPGDKVEWSSNRSIDYDNHLISDVDYNSLHNQANLMLLDLAIRTTNRTKYKNVKKASQDDAVTADAQYLAYSAYAPGNESLNNTTHSFAP